MNTFVPRVSTVFSYANTPWFNSYLCRLRRLRDRLFHRTKSLGSRSHLCAAYRKMRNLYVAELRHAERRYYLKQGAHVYLSSKCLWRDSHRWWKAAKAACGLTSIEAIPPLVSSEKAHLSAVKKAECLNLLFAKQMQLLFLPLTLLHRAEI